MRNIFEVLFGHPAIRSLPKASKREVNLLLNELIRIGELDDFLSLRPGGPFNARCHHTRARQIGQKLHEVGGLELMQAARSQVQRKLKPTMAEHLDYCWSEIGEWEP